MLRSIRVRLAGLYLAVLAGILLLFAGAVYFSLRATLTEEFDDSLESRALMLRYLVSFDPGGGFASGLSTNPADPNEGESFLRLFDASGRLILDSSSAIGDFPVDPADLQAAREAEEEKHFSTQRQGDFEARVITLPVQRGGAFAGTLQLGESTEDLQSILFSLLVVIFVALMAALLLAGLGGWWLATRALAPIDRMTRAARDISGGRDLERRLNLDLPDDEVGRLASTFDQMLARLNAAFERQRQFTTDASHELRTPLTAIRGQIEVALERPRDAAEYQRVLSAVNEQVDRMVRLISGLLLLARSDAGALPIQRERIDIADLVESVAEQVRPLAEQKGLELRVHGEGSPQAEADEDLLLQLVLNLADNAVKYTPNGSITLGWQDGASPRIFVQDTGPGIPTAHQERIFERFYRVDPARSRATGGVGLGLAIARWIAEAHGGELSLESNGAGATFTVTLPGSSKT